VGPKIVRSDARVGLSYVKYSFGNLHIQSFIKFAGTLNLYLPFSVLCSKDMLSDHILPIRATLRDPMFNSMP
jgi:hypothetical protein